MGHMTLRQKRSPGRRSKGEREAFNIKLPVNEALKIRQMADLYGVTYQDLFEQMITKHLQGITLESLSGQETLPIAEAS